MDKAELSAKRAILIAGPTASGKSALALAIAEHLGGTVINADSMQVYADLRILTARPPADEMKRVPHCLFGHVDAAETYSVGRWLSEAEEALAAAWATGRAPVLVGGTGLYLKALTQGLSAIPPVPAEVRSRLREEAATLAPATLHARLASLDPAMALRLRPTDPQRILRALEVFEATGRSLLTFQADREKPVLPIAEIAAVVIAPPRPELNRRIDRRFDAMIAKGGQAEIAALAARQLDPTLPAMRALGVPPLLAAFRGDMALDHAIAQAKLTTHHYAKRQMTFARHQLGDIAWTQPDEARSRLMQQWGEAPLPSANEACAAVANDVRRTTGAS